MWLPKDERRLLEFIYTQINNNEDKPRYLELDMLTVDALLKFLKIKRRSKHLEVDIYSIPQLRVALEHLQNRSLLKTYLSGRKSIQTSPNETYQVYSVGLSEEGYDLGEKYNNYITYSTLWWEEHRRNPLLVALLWFISLLAAFVVGKLSK